jgi:hypothetical protein
LNDPPNNERIRLHIEVGEGQLNGHHLSIKDSGGTPIIVFDGSVLGSVHFGWAALRYGSGGNWLIMHAGRIDLSGSPPTI